jgi:hypothetical protein
LRGSRGTKVVDWHRKVVFQTLRPGEAHLNSLLRRPGHRPGTMTRALSKRHCT